MTHDEFRETVHSIRNSCDIAFILMSQNRDDLLPTILEYAGRDMQHVMLEYCAVGIESQAEPPPAMAAGRYGWRTGNDASTGK